MEFLRQGRSTGKRGVTGVGGVDGGTVASRELWQEGCSPQLGPRFGGLQLPGRGTAHWKPMFMVSIEPVW